MKKTLLALFLCIFVGNTYAQQEPGIYYNNDKVGYSRIIGKNVGNIAGAYFTLGLSSAKSNKVIEGAEAELEIEEEKPEFVIVFGEDKQTEYIFTEPSNMNDIVLLKLHEKKSKRNLRTGKYGLTGVHTGIDEKDIIPIAIEKVDDNTFKVHPKKKLKEGEYCFYYTKKAPEGKAEFNGVFDFSID